MTATAGRLLPRTFFAGQVLEVAPALLGAVLTSPRTGVSVRLTEVEAYAGPADPASHAVRRTARTEVMYGPPGFLYVYFVYGMHWCANLVTGPDGAASAVLLRAGEVTAGLAAARALRPSVRSDPVLGRGPAAITTLLGLTGADSGSDLCRPGRVVAVRSGATPAVTSSGPRVGITRAAERPWRFWEAGAPSVTTFRAGTRRRQQTDDDSEI
ncbi:MAG: DNA-3-methyladenine glycosylase [Actinomycetota bacterium]|nr:DNA-3-methyladenine glycosylase [Actinomycetota bacterium]